MKPELFAANAPECFWRILGSAADAAAWSEATARAAWVLSPLVRSDGSDNLTLLAQTLGEGQFGDAHWKLSPAKQLYYQLKPILPRVLTRLLRRAYRQPAAAGFRLRWPVEDRYVRFQWETVRHWLILTGKASAPFVHFWPQGQGFALVLTHDVETAEGQAYIRAVADLEESLGFRSSFNFVPESYPLDHKLMDELRERGFEIGVHGLKHDDQLFSLHDEFSRRAERINQYVKDWRAAGFRAPLMLRQPEWMQELEVEYDLSFFDTDPFEPLPGGTMSVWPFEIGRFVELPYTLVQDYTLAMVLGEATPRRWLEKIAFLERYHGMALSLTHPDYFKYPVVRSIYAEFLRAVKTRNGYWHALPREAARWWRARARATSVEELPGAVLKNLRLADDQVMID